MIIDLDFDGAGEAEAFLESLRRKVWSRADLSPGLPRKPGEGTTPRTRIVVEVDSAAY